MRVSNLLKSAALGLFIGLAGACSNEEFQNGIPDQNVNLKDGEALVKMEIAGIGGTVVTRAGENITLPGEVEIKKLDLYCFKGSGDTPGDYTLERIYHYEAQGNTNDLALTPVGDGYQASFGVQKDVTDKRVFVLIANDGGGTRTTTLSTTTLSTVQGWLTQVVALKDTPANISTPLPMTATAGRNEYAGTGELTFNTVYTQDDIKNGVALNAELKRQVARIDVKNPVAAGFTITEMTLSGASNSVLFPKEDYSNIVEAVADSILTFAAKPVTVNAEMFPAAFYAYPVKNSAAATPKVVIKGRIGNSGDITVEAKFDATAMPSPAIAGMMPNTRYVVNLHNSEGNITADITIADWIPGETVDTEDAIKKLNTTATLAATENKAKLIGKDLFITFYVAADAYGSSNPAAAKGCAVDDVFATIEGASDDSEKKPIGIILPPDCDWITVEKNDGLTNQAGYNLKLAKLNDDANHADRPRTATLSLVTYSTSDSKQVINEYTIHQDYVDIEKLTGDFDFSGQSSFMLPCTFADVQAGTAESTYKFVPFALDMFLIYQDTKTAEPSGIDIIIPKDCSWLHKGIEKSALIYLAIDGNIGKEERHATIEARRWKSDAGGSIETKKITIIQEGVVDKSQLADGFEILLNNDLKAKNLIKMDGNTIIVAGEKAVRNSNVANDDFMFSIKANAFTNALKPILATFGTDDNSWITTNCTMGWALPNVFYLIEVHTPNRLGISDGAARELNFTVTTYVGGAPVEQTYRLIQKANDGTDVNGTPSVP